MVWRLDRLGRSLSHLISVVEDLKRCNIALKSLNESIDTSSPSGELIFHIFAVLAQFERSLNRERTNAGLAAARAGGRKGGGRYKLDARAAALAKQLYADKTNTIDDICRTLHISRATLGRYVKGRSSSSNSRW
jgi:DNA invertase Pin-like site-specific DNA recombinase